jgi:drug/metabolite transporter (DMT)-like permease
VGGVVFALLAALCNAVSVIARHIASTADPHRPTGRRLVGYLLRSPLWLAGWGAQAGAFAFQAVALHLGQVSVVQPLLVAELVIALVLRRVWIHQAIAGAAWTGAAAACAGLAVFIVAAGPRRDERRRAGRRGGRVLRHVRRGCRDVADRAGHAPGRREAGPDKAGVMTRSW